MFYLCGDGRRKVERKKSEWKISEFFQGEEGRLGGHIQFFSLFYFFYSVVVLGPINLEKKSHGKMQKTIKGDHMFM
jgi:hypothetical protein